MTPHEEWRPVAGYEDAYEVSDQGRVRSIARVVAAGPGVRQVPEALRRLALGSSGYLQVTLRRKTFTVHSLVAVAFLGPRPDGMEVCHNNGDPLDCSLANLRYDTVSENRRDTVRHGNNPYSNRTHCPQGHPYDETNTGSSSGYRRCLTCHRERQNRRYHAQKAASNGPSKDQAARRQEG